LFNLRDHIVPCLDYLNSKHTNIKFTFEIENDDNTLPFLDISLKRVNGNFETSVYRKPTFTDLSTNFERFLLTAGLQKRFHFLSLVSLLVFCSSYQIFHAELEKFKKLLLQNGYPKFFIDRCVKTFLDKMISPPLKVQTPTVSKLLIPIVFPKLYGVSCYSDPSTITQIVFLGFSGSSTTSYTCDF
jgi:hypothetical protein